MTAEESAEEVVERVLDFLLAEDDEIDTAVYADNVITELRRTGHMEKD